jgi:(5-formylfuran-3-yl)methyl phosphate synthase
MTKLLASIRSPAEAAIAIAGGADIIDLKEPAAGALGRLPEDVLRACLATVAGRRPVSATIGDLPLAATPVLAAARAMAETGVDIVKLGIFAGDASATIAALGALARTGVRLVAVCFADRNPDFDMIRRCADAGFYGVMLDTADKRAGSLTRHLPPERLTRFLELARARRLLAGLAGSLAAADLPLLLPLAPDFVGFRSALTSGGRAAPIDAAAVARLRAALDGAASSATAAAGAQSAAGSAMPAVAGMTLA